jgi:hypothetical protein
MLDYVYVHDVVVVIVVVVESNHWACHFPTPKRNTVFE